MPTTTTVTRLSTRWLALVAATGAVLYLCWLMLQPFVDVLLWAAVLAFVAWPVNRRVRRRGYSEHASAIVTTVLVVLVVVLPLTLVTAAVVRQAAEAAEGLQGGVRRLLDPNSALFQRIDQYFDLDILRDPKALASRFGSVGQAVASRSLGLIGGVLGGIVQVFFVLFTLYYLLRDSGRIVPAIRESLPLTPSVTETIFMRTSEVITASVNGVLVIAAVQGFLGMIAFLILGLPSALMWGVIMFLLSTIPMAGAAIVWLPAAIFLAATGHWGKAIFLVAWGALVIGMIDNVLRPKLVGKRAKLHELVIFFSVLGGLQVFGVLGLFVGPVVAALAQALLQVFHHSNAAALSAGDDAHHAPAVSGVVAVVAVPAVASGGPDGAIQPPVTAPPPAPPVAPTPDRSGAPG